MSPSDALDRYQLQSGQLTVLLYAFSVPIMGLLLAFIGLVVGLSVARQRNEVAVLRSRGATSMQVVGISFIESVLLAGIALAAAYYGAPFVAQIIGSTQTFLNFSTDADLRLVFNANTWRVGGFAVAVTVVAQLMPTVGASRFTIVTYKQEQARTLRPPWWQRAYLDVFLLIPAAYGIYLLQQQGNIAGPGPLTGATLFDNPLLFLVPALGALCPDPGGPALPALFHGPDCLGRVPHARGRHPAGDAASVAQPRPLHPPPWYCWS